jgi:hypothetical protein
MRTELFAVSVVWWVVGCAAPIEVEESWGSPRSVADHMWMMGAFSPPA